MSNAATAGRIADDLRGLGIRAGDVLLVHASLSALGRVPGGAQTVIAGLLAALGADGTLLMPALSYATVTPYHPRFDLALTPSNVGAIPETFRRQAKTQRSLHPTHSVCAQGQAAAALLARHGEDRTPCGQYSPFRLLPEYDGRILMLGCGLGPNTSFHAIEELVAPPYLFGEPIDYEVVNAAGERTVERYTPHNFAGVRQRYDRIGAILHAPGLVAGKVLDGTAHLLHARALWTAALDALGRDPLAFVEAIEPDLM